MKRKSCPTCWFAGLTPVDENPHGRLRWTCSLWDKRRLGGCEAWTADREDRGPTREEIKAMRDGGAA